LIIFKTVLAEKAERYDDLFKYALSLGRLGGIDKQDRAIFGQAVSLAIGRRRTSWRIMGEAEKKTQGRPNVVEEVKVYRAIIESEIIARCTEAIAVLDGSLSKCAATPEAQVFVAKQRADLYRYLSETRGDKKDVEMARKNYEEAMSVSGSLKPHDPMVLSTALNQSVFMMEILNNREGALKILEKAYGHAGKAETKNAKVISALMKTNLELWRSQ